MPIFIIRISTVLGALGALLGMGIVFGTLIALTRYGYLP